MTKIDKKEIIGCCGKRNLIWVLNIPISNEHLQVLQEIGFSFLPSYLDAGMLYVENKGIVVTGVFGQRELKIKCNNCNKDTLIVLEKHILNNFK